MPKRHIAMMFVGVLSVTGRFAAAQTSPQAGALILNEYNAVSSTKTLTTAAGEPWKGGDTFFGYQVLGNGGNWVELVVTQDHLNMQGWQLDWSNADPPGTNAGSVSFNNNSLWSNLRAGTIITVREDDTGTPGGFGALPTDTSFKPDHNDWWININVDDTNYVNQTGFKTDNDDWQGTIKDAQGRTVFGPIGENVPGWGGGGISSTEAGVNRSNPSASNSASDFEDNDYTTFGSPNTSSSATVTQDFSALRTWWSRTNRIPGDANLDRVVDMSDIYIFSQNWLTTGATWMDGDFNGDGKVDARDLGLMALNWQTASPGLPFDAALLAAGFVPEPASIGMAMLGLVGLVSQRRRRF